MNELCFLLAPYRGFRPVRRGHGRVTTVRFGQPKPAFVPTTTRSLAKAS